MSKRIGILTAGGDCPGLNAVIRSVTKTAFSHRWEVIGFTDGFRGVVENNFRRLSNPDVSGIINLGGTILGTSNVSNPFRFPVRHNGKLSFEDRSKDAIHHIRSLQLNALVCIGGDGTFAIAEKFLRKKIPIVGIPKTIDNDLSGTDYTFGFQTAVSIATDAVDRLHTTAASHHRVMILEVMGRYAGWIALYAGTAGGADVILIPEIPYEIDAICEHVWKRAQFGKRFSLVVMGEGAKAKGGKIIVNRIVRGSTDPLRLGGVGEVLGRQIESKTGIETRVSVLGHIQRGGSPIPEDRNLGTLLGHQAVELIRQKKFGYMAALRSGNITSYPIKDAIRARKLVPRNHPLIIAARKVGTSFG